MIKFLNLCCSELTIFRTLFKHHWTCAPRRCGWGPTAVTIKEPASQPGAGNTSLGEKRQAREARRENTMLTNNFHWCQGRMRPFVVPDSWSGYFQECTMTFHSFGINQKMRQNVRGSKQKCLLPRWVRISFLCRGCQEWAGVWPCPQGSPDWDKGRYS